jgi:hypothetical protein
MTDAVQHGVAPVVDLALRTHSGHVRRGQRRFLCSDRPRSWYKILGLDLHIVFIAVSGLNLPNWRQEEGQCDTRYARIGETEGKQQQERA